MLNSWRSRARRALKDRKVRQLGELVIATGADTLPIEEFAGVLIMAASSADAGAKEGSRSTAWSYMSASLAAPCAPA